MTDTDFRVNRTSPSNYVLRWPPRDSGVLHLAISDSPHHVYNSELLLELDVPLNLGEYDIALTAVKGPVFFHVTADDAANLVLMDRQVPLEGGSNFRDFGGYFTADGKQVRWQQLYRSGHLGTLSEADRELVADLDIHLVCDFRTPREHRLNPSQFAPRHQPRVAELIINPGDNTTLMDQILAAGKPDDKRRLARELMIHVNRELALDNAQAYRQMFALMLEAPGPTLIHCTAGKDRTGFGAALILAALGVPEKALIHDYLLTNEYVDPSHSIKWFKHYTGVELDQAVVEPLYLVHEDYISAALSGLKESYGSIECYFREALGLDDAGLKELRGRLLQD